MHRGSIRKFSISISPQCHLPLTLILLIWTLQRQSPRWVNKSTSATSFVEFQGKTSGMSSCSSWQTKTPRWLSRPMRLSPSLSKRKLQSRERMVSLQKLCSFQRTVAKVVVMVVKRIKAAEVQRGIGEMITEIIRTRGKRRMCWSAFIAYNEGISPRTASTRNAEIVNSLPTF